MTTVEYATLTPQQKIDVLLALVDGQSAPQAGAATGQPYHLVTEIQKRHGYPSVGAMERSIAMLTQQAREQEDERGPRASATPTPAPPPVLPAAIPPPAAQPAKDTVPALLDLAAASSRKRTQALGAKIAALLVRLTETVRREEEDRKAGAIADEAEAFQATKIAELQQQLDALKRKPASGATTGRTRHGGGGATYGDYPCTECGRHFDTAQGVALHRRRAHEGYDPKAKSDAA